MFEVAVEPLFNFLSGEYAEPFAFSRATAFQHPSWLDAIYRKLLPRANAAPLIITVRRDTGSSCRCRLSAAATAPCAPSSSPTSAFPTMPARSRSDAASQAICSGSWRLRPDQGSAEAVRRSAHPEAAR